MNIIEKIFWTKWKSERLKERNMALFVLRTFTEDWTLAQRKVLLDHIIDMDKAIWISRP